MKKPSKKQVENFLKDNFPHIEFDGVKFEESGDKNCHFKIYSFGRMIGQADYALTDNYWENVRNHLHWTFR